MEEITKSITTSVSHAVEITAALIIGAAILRVCIQYIRMIYRCVVSTEKEKIRIQFAGSVSVALELLLGADVLSTAIAPSWNDIGQLAAIATIRTVLNYFLDKDLKHVKTMG